MDFEVETLKMVCLDKPRQARALSEDHKALPVESTGSRHTNQQQTRKNTPKSIEKTVRELKETTKKKTTTTRDDVKPVDSTSDAEMETDKVHFIVVPNQKYFVFGEVQKKNKCWKDLVKGKHFSSEADDEDRTQKQTLLHHAA